jgi:hypothetical protein
MPATFGPAHEAPRAERVECIALCLVALVLFGIQFTNLSLVPRDAVSGNQLVDVTAPGAPAPVDPRSEPELIWREFRPGERLSASPAGWICAAALQRSADSAALVIRLCIEQPAVAERRYGLGYDSFVLGALLPGGWRLSYSLVNFRATGPHSAADFDEGPTPENSIPIRHVFVRDATDVVVVFDSDLPSGLPTIFVHGVLGGRTFSDFATFEPLGPAADFVQLELRQSANAPMWARRRP